MNIHQNDKQDLNLNRKDGKVYPNEEAIFSKCILCNFTFASMLIYYNVANLNACDSVRLTKKTRSQQQCPTPSTAVAGNRLICHSLTHELKQVKSWHVKSLYSDESPQNIRTQLASSLFLRFFLATRLPFLLTPSPPQAPTHAAYLDKYS